MNRAAAQTAFGFFFELLFGKGYARIFERFAVFRVMAGKLAPSRIIAFDNDILFVESNIFAPVAAVGQALSRLYKTVYGNCRLFAGCDCVYRKLRPRVRVAADENVALRGLIGKRIGLRRIVAVQYDRAVG